MDAAPVTTGGSIALAPAAVGGRRHKLKLVTKKKARKVLKKLGLKIRGGADAAADPKAAVALPAPLVDAAKMGGAEEPEMEAPAAGRRRKTKKGKKSRRSIFGY
jgi:hypothetical protein